MKILALLFPMLVLASGEPFSGLDNIFERTDLVWRVVNFLIFAGIMYYLLAKPAKAFYLGRIEKISSAIKASELKQKENQRKLKDAQISLEIAKMGAKEAVEVAQKDAVNIANRIEKEAQNDVVKLQNSFENKKALEVKKAKISSVSAVVTKLFDTELKGSQKELLGIILKKIS